MFATDVSRQIGFHSPKKSLRFALVWRILLCSIMCQFFRRRIFGGFRVAFWIRVPFFVSRRISGRIAFPVSRRISGFVSHFRFRVAFLVSRRWFRGAFFNAYHAWFVSFPPLLLHLHPLHPSSLFPFLPNPSHGCLTCARLSLLHYSIFINLFKM